MPTVLLTQEQREEHAEAVMGDKIRRMIRECMAQYDIRDVKELACATKLDYSSLRRKFCGDTRWDVTTLALLCDYFRLEEGKRADLLSWKVRKS